MFFQQNRRIVRDCYTAKAVGADMRPLIAVFSVFDGAVSWGSACHDCKNSLSREQRWQQLDQLWRRAEGNGNCSGEAFATQQSQPQVAPVIISTSKLCI